MAHFILDHGPLIIRIGRACIAAAVIAGVLAFLWIMDDVEAQFRATLEDCCDELADGGSDGIHDDGAGAA
jgi:hypothetical protein